MKVGIIGSGEVGQALGRGFATLGHEVKIGTREPAKLKAWLDAAGPKASTGTTAEAAAFGEVVLIATAWSGAENAIRQADPANFAGKVVIDVTNPLDFSQGTPRLALGHTDSAGEQVQRWLPAARVVKAFNIVGHPLMFRPQLPGGPPDMFICGNDAEAKRKVTEILRDFGWPTTDLGGIEGARYLEPLAMVWIIAGFSTKSWAHAFKLLKV